MVGAVRPLLPFRYAQMPTRTDYAWLANLGSPTITK
jgi:hypothetical protein